jgi:hypothetical protein
MVGDIKSERWARSFRNGGRHRAESASNAFHILISTRKSDINDEYYGSEGTYKYDKGQPHFLLRSTLIVYVIGKETAQLATRMIKGMTELCGGSAVVKGI